VAGKESPEQKARQLVLLGMLLQGLHILFGITAIIGVLVAHTTINRTSGTVYHSQLRWQIATFWLALAGYAGGLYLWTVKQYPYLMYAVLAWVIYRLTIGLYCWRREIAINRIL